MYATLGGLRWRFIPCDSLAVADVERAYGRFAGARDDRAIRVAIATTHTPLGDDRLTVDDDSDVVWFRRRDLECNLNLRASAATIVYRKSVPALETALGVAASFLLVRAGGFLAHATRHASHGRALLFGSSDQATAVLPDGDGGYRCFATPFFGGSDGPPGVVAGGLDRALFPSHATCAMLQPLRAADAVRRLLGFVFCFGSIAAHQRCLVDSAVAFVRAIPCFALQWGPVRESVLR